MLSKIKNMTVTATIDVSTPAGRKLVRELEKHKKIVKISNPIPVGEDGLPEKFYTVDEFFDEIYDGLSNRYGVDIRKI